MRQMEADVVVVACGMSGLAAATQAQESLNATGGGTVVAFEKSGTVGGAANMGMAFLAIESQLQKENMTNDFTKDDAFNYFMDYTHWRADAKLVRRWFNMSASTVEWVQKMGVEFLGVFKYFKNSHCTQHMVKAPGTNKPTERCAATMIQKIHEYAKEIGVDIQLHTSVKQILTGSKGQVRGVLAVTDDGEEIECLCNCVIIATGGIGNNVDMIQQYMGWKWGEDMTSFRIPGIDGDGLNMAWAIGAKKNDVFMEVNYNTPGTTDVFKTLSEVMRQPNLLVNLDGKRFFNEELMDNTTYTGNALLLQKKHMGFSIINSKIVEYYKEHGLDYITYHHAIKTMDRWEHEKELYFSGAQSDVENSVFASEDKDVSYGDDIPQNFFEFQSIEEMAETLGINLENLKKTIEEYNAMCNGWGNGYDWQFTKGPPVPEAHHHRSLLCGPSLPLRLRLPGRTAGQREHADPEQRPGSHPRPVRLRQRHRQRIRRQLLLLQPRLHHVLRPELRPYRRYGVRQVHELRRLHRPRGVRPFVSIHPGQGPPHCGGPCFPFI